MNRLFEAALTRTEIEADGGIGPWTPVADVHESPVRLRLTLEIPGLDREQIRLRVEGDELLVEGERPMEREGLGDRFHRVERAYGPFARRFRLPPAVDRASVDARYRNGVLEVTFTKQASDREENIPVSIR
jgi:HSP20 family protein